MRYPKFIRFVRKRSFRSEAPFPATWISVISNLNPNVTAVSVGICKWSLNSASNAIPTTLHNWRLTVWGRFFSPTVVLRLLLRGKSCFVRAEGCQVQGRIREIRGISIFALIIFLEYFRCRMSSLAAIFIRYRNRIFQHIYYQYYSYDYHSIFIINPSLTTIAMVVFIVVIIIFFHYTIWVSIFYLLIYEI